MVTMSVSFNIITLINIDYNIVTNYNIILRTPHYSDLTYVSSEWT